MDEVKAGDRAWIDFGPVDGRLAVRLGGELDIASLEQVADRVDELFMSPPSPAVIDLSQVEFMDSTGVALLIRLSNHFGSATIEHPIPLIRRTLEALGLTQRLGITAGPLRFERSFPRETSSVPASRRYLSDLIKDLPAEVVDTAALLVSELATNAVIHGSGASYQLGVEFDPASWEVRVSATDDGGGRPRALNPDATEEHGRGLQLVSVLSQQWGVHSHPGSQRKTVWFRLNAPDQVPAQP